MGCAGTLHRCADLAPAPSARTRSFQAALYPDSLGSWLRLRAGWPAAVKGGPGWHPLLPRSFFARTLLLVLLTLLFSKILTLRSEEHTSELQSRPHLVCRLLLEKKKKKQQNNNKHS